MFGLDTRIHFYEQSIFTPFSENKLSMFSCCTVCISPIYKSLLQKYGLKDRKKIERSQLIYLIQNEFEQLKMNQIELLLFWNTEDRNEQISICQFKSIIDTFQNAVKNISGTIFGLVTNKRQKITRKQLQKTLKFFGKFIVDEEMIEEYPKDDYTLQEFEQIMGDYLKLNTAKDKTEQLGI